MCHNMEYLSYSSCQLVRMSLIPRVKCTCTIIQCLHFCCLSLPTLLSVTLRNTRDFLPQNSQLYDRKTSKL